ncbi:general odorant-binding protein 56a-like [Condylostylus longicornis]|uniref:general odorant-binding protein 56a-like n=1 Tax=Condylostylus longicornis TaxID=2530218 RepID=UPI00244E196A|nr:general odorant-binding protein 56a-like [Condylostylus longicornis]
MKFLFEIVVLFTCCVIVTIAVDAEQAKSECLTKLEITNEEYETARSAKFKNPTQKIKCFFDCFGKKVKFISNSEIDADEIAKQYAALKEGLKPEDVKKIIATCKDKWLAPADTSDCDKAYNFTFCLYDNLKI